MGHLHEPLNGFLAEGVYVITVVEPGAFAGVFQIDIPLGTDAFLVRCDLLAADQTAVLVQNDVIACQQLAVVGAAQRTVTDIGHLWLGVFVIGVSSEHQMLGAVTLFLGHDAAGGTGGPAVLVIEPCLHVLLAALFYTGLDQRHVLVAEVGNVETGPHVHMGTAHTHLLQCLQLPKQLLFLQIIGPCPEGGAPIFTARVTEQFL